ncbi:MAG: hypothetical protein HY064_07465 [Bacteroidetes bacterium]|nr:hypothetical protein [Bacteroidota bacterium]
MELKIISLSVVTFFIFSCSDDQSKTKSDSTSQDSAHGLTVSVDTGHAPHKVKGDVKDGDYEERYDNGVIYMKGEVKNGLREGTWMSFFRDGKIYSQGTYKDGLREGFGVSFYANGDTSSVGYYKKDKQVGKWKFWDEYGQNKVVNFPEK